MVIETYFCGSCASACIKNLGDHRNALEAMTNFCQDALGKIDSSWKNSYSKLEPFYVFIAGPEVAAGLPGSSHHSKPWVKYGTEFAKYIEDNELGLITTLPAKYNLKHHKETTCQIWLWSPEQKSMEKHWETLQGNKKSKKREI